MKTSDCLRRAAAVGTVGLMLGLTGCPSGSSDSTGFGTLSLGVADTPVDGAQHVVVAFTGVQVHGPKGTASFVFDQDKTIDLLTLQGNASAALLSGQILPAGQYQWIRLQLDLANSYVVTSDGSQYPLTVPSGDQTGLKLVSGFTVAQNGESDYVIDFDLRKSLTEASDPNTGTKYILHPALRLMNEQEVGSVAGTAANTLMIGTQSISDPACSPAAYVYDGTAITPEGFYVTVDGGTPPITSATLTLDSDTGNYDYSVGFLAPGTYTLAVTCAANDVEGGTSLAFATPKTVDVSANQTASLDFP